MDGNDGPLTVAQTHSFWSRVDRRGDAECWQWMGVVASSGYGVFPYVRDGRQTTTRPHRLAYTMTRGTIPDGLTLDHLCRNRACVNPAHLEPVTQAENNRRALLGKASHAAQVRERPNKDGTVRYRLGVRLDGRLKWYTFDRRDVAESVAKIIRAEGLPNAMRLLGGA